MKIIEKFNTFLDSYLFDILLSVITIFSFIFNIPYLAYFTLFFALLSIVILKKDFKSIITMIILLYANNKDFVRDFKDVKLIILVILFSLIGIIILVRIGINCRKLFDLFKKDTLFYCLLAILLSMLLSLINTPVLQESMLGICFWLLIMLSYILVKATVVPSESNRKHIIFSILLSALLLSFEIIWQVLFNLHQGMSFENVISKKALNLGWGNINHIAAFIIVASILAVLYYIYYRKALSRCFSIISLIIYSFIIVISGCRGGYLALLIVIPAIIFVYLKYKKIERITFKNAYPLGIFVLLISITLSAFNAFGIIDIMAKSILNKGFNPFGRDQIYGYAIKSFKLHPIFGSGVYTAKYYIKYFGFPKPIYNYHNHFLQILATCGIIGAVTFICYVLFSIKRTIKKDLFSIFTLIIIIYFIIHGAVDTLYFNAYIMPLQCVLLALIPETKFMDEVRSIFNKKRKIVISK